MGFKNPPQKVPVVRRASPVVRVRPTSRRPSLRLRHAVLARDGFRCVYCGAAPDHASLHVDHKISWADGGLTTLDNLVTACFECNSGKGATSVHTSLEGAQSVSEGER